MSSSCKRIVMTSGIVTSLKIKSFSTRLPIKDKGEIGVFGISLSVLGPTFTKKLLNHSKLHILRVDAYTRTALLLAGAFGAYSLGANNIANVMGVFVPIAPFSDINLINLFIFSSK